MSFSNTTVFNQYSGNGVDTSFNITFTFLQLENQIRVKVYDVVGTAFTEVVPTPTFAIDELGLQQVNFTVAPSGTQEVIIYREGNPTQQIVYDDYKFPFDTVEKHFDRTLLLLQEHDKMLESANLKDYYNPNGNDPTNAGSSGYNIVNHLTGTHTAVDGDLVYLADPSNPVTVELPAGPAEGAEVVVKEASGAFANKTIDGNGNTIVGEGATYALQSSYEATRLIFSTAGWLIV